MLYRLCKVTCELLHIDKRWRAHYLHCYLSFSPKHSILTSPLNYLAMSALNTAEDFLTLVNKLVQFILAHHKTALLPQTPEDKLPPFLADAEKYLIRITNPYTPSEETTLAAHHNARQWVSTTLTLLQDHYRRIRERVIADITPLLLPAWNRALLVAIRQARRKTPSIRDTTIEAARVMLSDIMSPSFPLSAPAPTPTQSPLPCPSQMPQLSREPLEPWLQGSSCLDTATLSAILPSTPPMETTDSAADRPPPPLSPVINIVRPNPDLSNGSPVRPHASSSPPIASEAKKASFDITAPVHPSTSVPTPVTPKPSGSLRHIPLFTTHPHHGDKFKIGLFHPVTH